jgi:cytochrome c nitrite reductase small subunit
VERARRRGSTLPVAAAIVVGIALGVGGFTFVYARGGSYLTNNPAACANCHVMQDQYSGWLKSSHRAVAVCNDCHTPHTLIGKYFTKASNGFLHSFAFTSGEFHEPIAIKARSRAITERACRNCHADIVDAIERHRTRLPCLTCHRSVGHLEGS